MSRRSRTQNQDTCCAKQREKEHQRAQLLNFYKEAKSCDTISRNAQSLESKIQTRQLYKAQYEREQQQAQEQAEKLQQLAKQRLLEEKQLAAELERHTWESEKQSKEIQLLANRSDEIRKLREQLRIAEMKLERSQQLQQKQSIELHEKEYDQAMDQMMMMQHQEELIKEQHRAQEQSKREFKAKEQLDLQLKERMNLAKIAKEQYERERALVDEVMKRIEEQETAEAEARRKRQKNMQADINEFLIQQQELRKRQREAEAAEEKRIAEYMRQRREREDQEAARKSEKREALNRKCEILQRQQEEEQARKEEEEALLDLLGAEMEAERARHAAEEQRRRKEQMKLEMIQANEYQKKLKAEKAASEKKSEQDFRQKMMDRLAGEDHIEQLNAQRRRQKVAEHNREVERLIAYRRQLYEAVKAAELADVQRQLEEEHRQAVIVQAEKHRMLQEATHLQPFLPKDLVNDISRLHLSYV